MQHRFRNLPAWFGMLTAAFVAAGGCGVLNPSLVTAVGGNTINADLDPPDGYVMILVMNRATVAVQATLRVTKENNFTATRTYQVGPLSYIAEAQDCDTAAILFDNFSDGTTTTPANLGTLTRGTAFNCGSVIAITGDGTPPTFTVEVF